MLVRRYTNGPVQAPVKAADRRWVQLILQPVVRNEKTPQWIGWQINMARILIHTLAVLNIDFHDASEIGIQATENRCPLSWVLASNNPEGL